MGFLIRLRSSGALRMMPPTWAKLILVLYSHRDVRGFAWPSTKTLAQEAGVHKCTVLRFIKWARVGLGVRVTRKKCNSYYLPINEKIDLWELPRLGNRPKVAKEAPKEQKGENA